MRRAVVAAPRYRRTIARGLPRRHVLDLEDDREDHRTTPGAVEDELTDGVVDVLLEELQLPDVLARQREATALASSRASSSSGPGSAKPRAITSGRRPRVRSAPHRGDDDQDAVLRESAPVAQRRVS